VTIMNTIKRLPRWAQVVAVLTVIYLSAFQLPSLWATLVWVWRSIQSRSSTGILIGLIQITLLIVGMAIWLLSVYLCSRALWASKKKAYAFLLMYLMMCTVTSPLLYASRKLSNVYVQRQIREMPKEQQTVFRQAPMHKTTTVVVTRDLSLPVGPALLLLAIWFMCKSEGVRLTNKHLEHISNSADAV
jgi:hypothetical protein